MGRYILRKSRAERDERSCLTFIPFDGAHNASHCRIIPEREERSLIIDYPAKIFFHSYLKRNQDQNLLELQVAENSTIRHAISTRQASYVLCVIAASASQAL